MDDVFAALSAGSRFKRKERQPKAPTEAAADDPVPAQAAQALDFFGDAAPPQATQQSKQSKKTKKAPKTRKRSLSATEVPAEQDAPDQQALEQQAALRRRLRINVSGNNPPELLLAFQGLRAATDARVAGVLLRNVERSRFAEPTAIQMQAVPAALAGRDVLGVAPTGSGKTAAFALPLIAQLREPSKKGVRALILAPTRELAAQITAEVDRLALGLKLRCVQLSKATAAAAAAALERHPASGCDVLVSTPLRLVHVLANADRKLSLHRVKHIVLDEADRLLDDTFVGQLDDILAACTAPHLQRLMFSATFNPAIEEVARSVLRDPVRVSVGNRNAGAATIDQQLVFVGREEGKLVAMRNLVQEGLKPPVLVFLQSSERASQLFRELVFDDRIISVDVLHAGRSQQQRADVTRRFRAGEVAVLIATDLIARGIDFRGVSTVVNWDLPQSATDYIHRIGRTGRAGREGRAVTFFTEDDMPALRGIANVMRISGCDVPDWMLAIKKESTRDKRRKVSRPTRRADITTTSAYDRRKAAHKRNMVSQSGGRGRGGGRGGGGRGRGGRGGGRGRGRGGDGGKRKKARREEEE